MQKHHVVIDLQKNISGFGLIEVLIAVAILSVGMLGLASLQSTVMKNVRESDNTNTASMLAEDIARRIVANPLGLGPLGLPGQTTSNYLTQYIVTAANITQTTDMANCHTTTGCNASSLALEDIREWKQSLENSLPGGGGEITSTSPYEAYTIKTRFSTITGATKEYTMNVNFDPTFAAKAILTKELNVIKEVYRNKVLLFRATHPADALPNTSTCPGATGYNNVCFHTTIPANSFPSTNYSNYISQIAVDTTDRIIITINSQKLASITAIWTIYWAWGYSDLSNINSLFFSCTSSSLPTAYLPVFCSSS